MIDALTSLFNTLTSIVSRPGALDSKLAEYAFVPVSQVLRLSRQVPVRALELCLECVLILLRSGWGGGLEPALSGQLLILCTFLAKPSSAENGITATSEELQALSFKCISELLHEASRSQPARDALTATNNIPALGEAVLITLDSLAESQWNSIKLAAVDVIKQLNTAIVEDDALASFFPKIVSSLTRILTPGSSNKAGYRVVEQGLEALTLLFTRLLSDNSTKDLPSLTSADNAETPSGVLRSTSWLQATAPQIKIALANIYKMRNHDKSEVRRALLKLCLCVMRDCRKSLADCISMSIETVIGLIGRDGANDAVENELRTTLLADHKLADLLRESLHDWVVSFPRIMRSMDDNKRHLIIHQISVTLRVLGPDQANIGDRLADALRNGLSAVLTDSKGLEELHSASTGSVLETGLMLGPNRPSKFQAIQLRLKGQQNLMSEFRLLLSQVARSDCALSIAQDLVQTIGNGSKELQLATYWVSVNLVRDLSVSAPSLNDFIDTWSSDPQEELLEDLYSHSITILTNQDPHTALPWQFHALAMETVALQAEHYQKEFRAELGEVLYPILHQLGSPNPALRDHAITCLNLISDASGYASARDLVVGNVDYVVNAVGLKLAVGDISPQAPQVLLMMMRLCGPSLLPHLDDLVGSIFEALERYHGYPKLVELLFSVLKGMTEEGVKAPQLAIEAPPSPYQTPVGHEDTSMSDVIAMLKALKTDKLKRAQEAAKETPTPFPQTPWKEETPEDPDTPDNQPPPEPPSPPPPAPRTYQILLKVSELTQHYLTSASPSLRTSLLSLLRTTIPALAKHETTFLPLINTLWPILLPRLQDPEAYIVSNTLEVIGVMCEYAGSFMRSRIEAAFEVLKKVHRRTQDRSSNTRAPSMSNNRGKFLHASASATTDISTPLSSLTISSPTTTSAGPLDRPELYTSAPARMIWDSLVTCLCTIAAHVPLRDELFEEILDALEPVLTQPGVRRALEKANADAVWLRVWKKERQSGRGVVRERPVGRRDYGFVKV